MRRLRPIVLVALGAAALLVVPAASGDHAATLDRPPNSNGWYNSPVGVTPPPGYECTPDSYSGPDRNGSFSVTCTDPLGSLPQIVDDISIKYDATDPNVTVDPDRPPDSGGWYTAPVNFTVTRSDAMSGIESCDAGGSYSGPDDPSATVTRSCTDNAGNSASDSFDFKYDASAPTVSIGQKPSNPSSDPTPTFGFTSDESNVTFWCSLDGSPAAQCDNPKTYSNVGAGSHTFRVFAVDSAGNSGNEASYTWTVGFPPVNEVRPTIEGSAQEGRTLTANPGQWSGTGTPTFAYLWQRCNEGGGGCENAGTGKTHLLNDEDVDHKMKVTVTATNAFGDASESSNLVPAEGVVSDVTAPQIHLSRTPADVTRRRSAVFAFTSDDRHARFMCKRDRQLAFWPCTSPVVFRRLRAGEHVFYVQATDRSGETSNHDHPWTIDRTPPPRPAGFVLRGGDRRVVATWTNPNVGDFAFVRVVRAGSPNVVVYQGRKTRFRDRKVRNGKRYVYKIRAFDRAGNRSKRIKRVIRPRDPLFSPREGQRIRIQRPPLFRWKADRSARSYNVQLHYRTAKGWRKIQSVFPTQARYQLPSRWRYDGRRQRFKRGLYVVHVWPWYGSRFGRLIGTNTFRGV